MPGYISIYALLPRQAGGKLLSDPLTRLAFLLLLVFSVPVGTHHQYMDPGISPVIKGIVTGLTLSVAVPSLITAFTIAISLEYAGRKRGGRGWLGWWTALPWDDPVVAAQVLALVTFIFGGAGGIVNASWQLDAVVHNTIWIPGHFHLTVGTMTALVFMGISYWLLPHLTGRKLYSRKLALASTWLYFIGMLVFSVGMHWGGLDGVPRRAWISSLPADQFASLYGADKIPLALAGIGGMILALASIAFYIVFWGTLFGKRDQRAGESVVPFAEVLVGPEGSTIARISDKFLFWTVFTLVITLAVYIPVLWVMFQHPVHAIGMKGIW
ncbi:cytochrome c oxidase subunit 1 [mine drainage metagenome]|uniref:Cytochrome c oxidase subunit 1 n=1 Tax=mine drainage metagenome TaxID=410659 RepID=A0A1J5PUT6_9ZZZZ